VRLPVVADADTLFPATTRGLLIYLDFAGLIRLHWSPMILDEVARALVDAGRKKTLGDAKAHEARMRDALPHALVTTKEVQAQFESVAHAVRSTKDIHVAACAYHLIAADAYAETRVIALVTRNTKDFRKGELAKLGVALHKPDEFLVTLFQSEPQTFSAAFRHFRTDLSSHPQPAGLLERLHKDGQVQVVTALRSAFEAGSIML
jgi:hypothetical protein